MKIKTSELEGAPLDWAVALATKAWDWAHSLHPTRTLDPTFESACIRPYPRGAFGSSLDTCILIPRNPMRQDPSPFCPSTEWSHGGPIMEAEQIELKWVGVNGVASRWYARHQDIAEMQCGATPLIAACRAIVAAKLGDTVDVPEELV